MSRSIDKFRNDAIKYAKIVDKKSAEDVEKLVSVIYNINSSHFEYTYFKTSFGDHYKIVLRYTGLMFLAVYLIQESHGTLKKSKQSWSK